MILVAGAWWIARPKGELRLTLVSSVEDEAELAGPARAAFQSADAAVDDAAENHALLSFDDSASGRLVKPPTMAPPGEPFFRRIVRNFVITTKVNDETGQIEALVDGRSFLEQLYETFGWQDYFIIVANLEVGLPCGEQGPADCLRIVVRYGPSELTSERFFGTLEKIADDLAVLIMRGAAQNAGGAWRKTAKVDEAPPFLEASSTPSNMKDLVATAKGLRILKLGGSDPACTGRTDPGCLALARELLEAATSGEELNPAAALGLALIELDAALRDARQLRPALSVEAHLSKVETYATQARQSEFLRAYLASETDPFPAGLLRLDQLARSELAVGLAGRFACALADYRRLKWGSCIDQIGDISAVPEPFRPYLEAAKFDSLLNATKRDTAEHKQHLADMEAALKAHSDAGGERQRTSWFLRGIRLVHLCDEPNLLDDAAFGTELAALKLSAPTPTVRNHLVIETAGCRSPDTEVAEVAAVQAWIDALGEGGERMSLDLALARYYARRGDADTALERAVRARALPWMFDAVRNSPDFEQMLSNPEIESKLFLASFEAKKLTDLEKCRTLEF